MLNLCPYNGGPDVEFSELILQFSHHFYFSFFIIKTLPTPPPTFFLDHTTRHHSPGIKPVSPAVEAQSPNHQGIPETLLLKKNFHYFIYLFIFLAVLGLCCCTSFSLVVVSGGYSLDVVCKFLVVVGGFSLLWRTGPRHMGFSSCSTRA